MIPNRSGESTITNNFDAADTGQFSVDENSLGKIMSILTDLYSDPEMAVVREYLTNAYDAQIDAQNADPNYKWRPIEVTTPSHFSREYRVRDFGIGMSADDIRDIYTKYGKSTKEASNDVTGMLGLGSKCALTYTGQFTIIGYKGGVKTSALVSKDDNDIPSFMIVDTCSTTEPNGVEISVPVRDSNSFKSKTASFLRWWAPDTVLVNGEAPKPHGKPEVKPGIFLNEADQYGDSSSWVIMGNVPYEVDNDYVDSGLRELRTGFIAYVPMGAVSFPPNREKLFYNNKTKAYVKDLSKGLAQFVVQKYLDDVANAPTFRDAYIAHKKTPYHIANSSVYRNNVRYKGLDVPNQFSDIGTKDTSAYRTIHRFQNLWRDYQDRVTARVLVHLDAGQILGEGRPDSLIITGVEWSDKTTPTFRKKALYLAEQSKCDGVVILVKDDVDNRWLDHVKRVTAEDIKAVKLPKTGASAPRKQVPWNVWSLDSAGNPTLEETLKINTGKKTLVYISPADMRESYRKHGTSAEKIIKLLGNDYMLAVEGTNRHDKFLREHPSAITARKAFEDIIDTMLKNVNKFEYLINDLSHSNLEFLKNISPKAVKDPEIAAMAAGVQSTTGKGKYTEAINLASYIRRANISIKVPDASAMAPANPLLKYPLVGVSETTDAVERAHLLFYVNALWSKNFQV